MSEGEGETGNPSRDGSLSAAEFRALWRRTGLATLRLSALLGVHRTVVREWSASGVPDGDAEWVRDALLDAALRRQRSSKNEGELVALLRKTGVPVRVLASAMGLHPETVRRWIAQGVPEGRMELVTDLLSKTTVSGQAFGEALAAADVAPALLARKAKIQLAAVQQWQRDGVPALLDEHVRATLADLSAHTPRR